MMHILPKWKVTVSLTSGQSVVFSISDILLSNVLRTVATIQFESEPTDLLVTREPVVEARQGWQPGGVIS